MLYTRMLLIMAISLYTSRVVLITLGIEDFGIFNVVGGFVSVFGFLNNAMATSTQRFLSFELGQSNFTKLRNTFSMSVNIHILIALVIFIFAQTIGRWFVVHGLIIPSPKQDAAMWVYQFSILTLLVNIIGVPYNSLIIAYEKMNIFAFLSVLEASLKLFIVFLLQKSELDKLIFYSFLLFLVSLVIRGAYGVYCNVKYKESRPYFFWDKRMFSILSSFAGWNLWGNIAGIILGQGLNVLLNVFFGPIVNAAYSVALRVKETINQFVSNFQLALSPQIIKYYATEEISQMHKLIFLGSKYSFFLLLGLTLPLLFETEMVLTLWLKLVPEYTVVFTRLSIAYILLDSISKPLMTAAQASGRVKLYQGVVGGLLILILPITYVFLKFGHSPVISLQISIVIGIIAFFVRLRIVSNLVGLNVCLFLKNVVLKALLVTVLAGILPGLLFIHSEASPGRLVLVVFSSLISVFFFVFFVGMQREERNFVLRKIKTVRG